MELADGEGQYVPAADEPADAGDDRLSEAREARPGRGQRRSCSKKEFTMRRATVFTGAVCMLLAMMGLAATTIAAEANGETQSKFEKDRQAILAMAGTYDVHFQARETVALQSGYELREPFEAGATELVKVVEDEGERIVLQHLLLVGDEGERQVIKHWRQTWRYEPDFIYQFRGNRTWRPRALSEEEAAGRWSERVSHVGGSPRYEGLGKWRHAQNLSAWQSGETWRPLPRRESKKRSDYDVLVSRNRYTLTPGGWVHEQDSYKLALQDGQPEEILAREVALNRYQQADSVDPSAADQYWQRTGPFWQQVRDAWGSVLAQQEPVRLKEKVDGKTLWQHMFERAGQIEDGQAYDKDAGRRFIDKTLERFLIRK
jgi:hypothetical protein